MILNIVDLWSEFLAEVGFFLPSLQKWEIFHFWVMVYCAPRG